MNCIDCKYYKQENVSYGSGNISLLKTCDIVHAVNPKSCSLESDSYVDDMNICYNCENWIGGGDWGLSCKVDYYNCNSNGFEVACDKFVRRADK